MTSEKRLLRSRKALIGGVCAGVADYFNVDPVIVRIIMVVFTLAQSRASGRLALCASPVRLGRSCAARAPGRRIARLCRCACRCFSFVCASGEPFA